MYEQTGDRGPSNGHIPWNKGRLTGQKRPFTLKQIWEIRIRLQIAGRVRDLALLNLGIDSKLRGCDLVRLHVSDVAHGDQILSRAKVLQQKTAYRSSFHPNASRECRESYHAFTGNRFGVDVETKRSRRADTADAGRQRSPGRSVSR